MVEAARHIGGYPTMMIRLLMAGALAGLIVSSPAFAQDKASQKFLKEAMEGNLAEVQMGQLAQKNGGSDRVRSFGQMLQKDHSDANENAAPSGRHGSGLFLRMHSLSASFGGTGTPLTAGTKLP